MLLLGDRRGHAPRLAVAAPELDLAAGARLARDAVPRRHGRQPRRSATCCARSRPRAARSTTSAHACSWPRCGRPSCPWRRRALAAALTHDAIAAPHDRDGRAPSWAPTSRSWPPRSPPTCPSRRPSRPPRRGAPARSARTGPPPRRGRRHRPTARAAEVASRETRREPAQEGAGAGTAVRRRTGPQAPPAPPAPQGHRRRSPGPGGANGADDRASAREPASCAPRARPPPPTPRRTAPPPAANAKPKAKPVAPTAGHVPSWTRPRSDCRRRARTTDGGAEGHHPGRRVGHTALPGDDGSSPSSCSRSTTSR